MKKFLLAAIFSLTVCLVSMGNTIVAKGQSNSSFGAYKIEQLEDHLMFKNKELDQYLITYERSDMKVVVAVDKQKKCKKYYVLSDKLPIQYECNGVYFGIKKLDKELANKGVNNSLVLLNKEEYYHHRVLTSELTGTIEHLNLIASYYPGLYSEPIS